MDWNMIITIAISIIGSSAVFGFVQFLITRRDAKKNKKNEILEELKKLNLRVDKLENKFDENNATNARVRILRFADEVRLKSNHSKENFDQVLLDIDNYEKYCTAHPEYTNSKTGTAVVIIKEVYQECVKENSFLT